MGIFHKEKGFIGVDIGAHGIKLVELHEKKGRPQLWTYGIVDEPIDIHPLQKIDSVTDGLKGLENTKASLTDIPTPLDPRIEQYANMLRALVKESKVTSGTVTASIPVSYVFHAVVTLPRVEEKDIDRMVRAEIQKLLPRPIEEMQILHQVIPTLVEKENKSHNIRLLVTAAPKDLVRFYSAIFAKAGLELRELETEAFALTRSLIGRDESTAVLVDVGAERTNIFIVDQHLPMTHRSIMVGGKNIDDLLAHRLGVSVDEAEQVKYDVSRIAPESVSGDIFQSALEPISKEIQYSMNLFLRQMGNEQKKPERIVLTGGSSVFPFLAAHLEAVFGIKTFVGDPWSRVVFQQGLRPALDPLAPRMSVAVGLALRNLVKE